MDVYRNGMTPGECGKSLTVGELIEALKEFREDTPVYFRDEGFAETYYGNVYDSLRLSYKVFEDEEEE
jgi:hypothetical protein